jgi:hypothetical protein
VPSQARSISLFTCVISSDFRSKAANTFVTKGESGIFSLAAVWAGGWGRAGGRLFGTPLACLDNFDRNSNPKYLRSWHSLTPPEEYLPGSPLHGYARVELPSAKPIDGVRQQNPNLVCITERMVRRVERQHRGRPASGDASGASGSLPIRCLGWIVKDAKTLQRMSVGATARPILFRNLHLSAIAFTT